MQKSIRNMISALALSVVSVAALAQPAQSQEFVISGGSTGGTYDTMVNNLIAYCGPTMNAAGFKLIKQPGGNSSENIDALTGKSDRPVDIAPVQLDAAFLRRDREMDGLSGIKTLATLHSEELHWVTLKGKTVVRGAKVLLGKTVPGTGTAAPLSTIDDLAGLRLGAVGGSASTALIVQQKTGINYQIVRDFKDNAALKQALDEGKIDAFLAVTGSPGEPMKDMGEEYKLLSIPAQYLGKEAALSFYNPAKISYRKMGPDNEGVETASIPATLLAREFNSPVMQGGLATLRKCFNESLPLMKDDRKVHAKWREQSVKPSLDARSSKWPWYELPAPVGAKK
jgi:TRAP-type uncharacterized transport system substrate-binding protein